MKARDGNYPEKFWHCCVLMKGDKKPSTINDLSFLELQEQVIQPWTQSRPFTVAGKIVRTADGVETIKIAQTPDPQRVYSEHHFSEMRAKGVMDLATDPAILPISLGHDFTYELLFSGIAQEAPTSDLALIKTLCKRLPNAARVLGTRGRKKKPYRIEDEYDVQDLLQAILRAYVKHSVQEDPLPKAAGIRASRADLSIEDLGILIEVKFVRGPDDQRRIFDEFSQDLVLYAKWAPLKTLVFLIYNSADLRDPEAFEKLSGQKEIGGKRFDTTIVLA